MSNRADQIVLPTESDRSLPGLCVSIVSHAQRDLTSLWLESLLRAPPRSLQQVVYTRNVPEAPLPAAAQALPGLHVIDNPFPKGFGANHNAAFACCHSPMFVVLNPDITWDVEPFGAMLAMFHDDPLLGVVGPSVVSPAGYPENSARRLYSPVEVLSQKRRARNHAPNPAWLAGMCLMLRSRAYASVNGFDEGFHLYVEDVDLCSRLRLAGWRLTQCDAAVVVHHARRASHRSWRHAAWHLSGMVRYWTSSVYWRYRSLLAQQARAEAPDMEKPPNR